MTFVSLEIHIPFFPQFYFVTIELGLFDAMEGKKGFFDGHLRHMGKVRDSFYL